ncbi:hypothetical protein DVH24_033957 [Malus domestica]|uniref:RNase H type-1 domain-containing protein n=1 Tax=Malus domestica TaxID=3750 RepID=A0A498KMG1_MALDO|nr:hypothetical protein DVH24_033957 [Malus domestica]
MLTAIFVAAMRTTIKALRVSMDEAIVILEGFREVIVKSDSREIILCLHNSIENDNWKAFPILRKNILIRAILSIIPLVLGSKINQHDDGSLGIT